MCEDYEILQIGRPVVAMFKLTYLGVCYGRFHSKRHAKIAARLNGRLFKVERCAPYELADFTISHEFQLYRFVAS